METLQLIKCAFTCISPRRMITYSNFWKSFSLSSSLFLYIMIISGNQRTTAPPEATLAPSYDTQGTLLTTKSSEVTRDLPRYRLGFALLQIGDLSSGYSISFGRLALWLSDSMNLYGKKSLHAYFCLLLAEIELVKMHAFRYPVENNHSIW